MDDKLINFHIYRYHLLPIESANQQVKLFNDKKITAKEIKERKNEFFAKTLANLEDSKNSSHPLKLEHSEGQNYLFKLAQNKTTNITKDFKNIKIADAPYAHVVLNNDPSVQKIAISDNKEAFSSPEVVKNILKKLFRRDLEKFGLNIEIEALYDKVEFWKYVSKHRKEITYLNFEFIKPNLANISKSLPLVFKNFVDNTNSHESHIIIKAPEKGTLVNIKKSNEAIKGLVDYTSEGAGSIKLKVKGIRKQISTKEKPVTIQVRELDIEGPAEQVIKLYKTIIE
ncbi:hypothetical protein ES677_05210 [Bizionia gelidisalsuginis]|uniref:Uncharacterized protein n=1 Tax=Bizionia gelidisalsuginis TaxID=291188 RepID=A0ABY3MBT4_9FLAO|nr:hypothetical protein [Bizionia gelidisalsuginis]TYC14780.1 hypothetical protein ES677_05210 [Bizionia gelidisalsuginis]